MLPKQMEKIRDQYVALEKLEEFHQQKMGSTLNDSTSAVLFLTWPASQFGNNFDLLCFAHFCLSLNYIFALISCSCQFH